MCSGTGSVQRQGRQQRLRGGCDVVVCPIWGQRGERQGLVEEASAPQQARAQPQPACSRDPSYTAMEDGGWASRAHRERKKTQPLEAAVCRKTRGTRRLWPATMEEENEGAAHHAGGRQVAAQPPPHLHNTAYSTTHMITHIHHTLTHTHTQRKTTRKHSKHATQHSATQ